MKKARNGKAHTIRAKIKEAENRLTAITSMLKICTKTNARTSIKQNGKNKQEIEYKFIKNLLINAKEDVV